MCDELPGSDTFCRAREVLEISTWRFLLDGKEYGRVCEFDFHAFSISFLDDKDECRDMFAT